jgi:hypothetical protein
MESEMKNTVLFLMGLLFIIGCTKNSNDSRPITQGDDSNSITINKPKEWTPMELGNIPIQNHHSNQIKFEEKSTLGRGNYIEVKKVVRVGPNHSQYKRLKGKPVLVTIGWISKSQDSVYRYYEPETNVLNPTFTETDLEVLKGKIKSHLSNP